MISLRKALTKHLSPATRQWITRLRRPRLAYLPFRRLTPISPHFGFDRGDPIDRYYIESFLEQNRQYVRGRCLEVKDAEYTRRLGGAHVTAADILDIDPDNPKANVRGDLRKLDAVAEGTYDCVILTQVLQYIDDVPAAVAETHRILKPGGTALITVPFMMRLDTINAVDFWRFTPNSLRFLLGPHFPPGGTEVRTWGNLAAGLAFWIGLSQQDLRRKHLDHHDEKFGCTLSARATKAKG